MLIVSVSRRRRLAMHLSKYGHIGYKHIGTSTLSANDEVRKPPRVLVHSQSPVNTAFKKMSDLHNDFTVTNNH